MHGFRAHFLSLLTLVGVLTVRIDARILYVTPQGNDATAEPDNPARPFQNLTNAFRNLRNGDRMEVGAGKYTVTPGFPNTYYPLPDKAPMKLQNLTNVSIIGKGDVEIYGEGEGSFLMAEFCNNVRIENLTFKGNHPPFTNSIADLYTMVLLRGQNDSIQFDACRFVGFGDHAISHLFGAKTSVNLLVTNCYFADGGALTVPILGVDGAAISGISSGSRIVNNKFENLLRGIEVEGVYDGTITNVLIQGNTITDCYGVGIMVFATCHLGFSEVHRYRDVRIINNVVSNMFWHPQLGPYVTYGILVWGGEKMLVAGNRVEQGRLGMGIDVSAVQRGMKDVTVVSNLVQDFRFRGIQVYAANEPLDGGLIQGNIVRRVGDEGIKMKGNRLECRDNIVEDTAYADIRASIALEGGTNGVISDNTITNSSAAWSECGIWLKGTTNTVVYGNTFHQVPGGAIKDEGINTKTLPKVRSLRRRNTAYELAVAGLPGVPYFLEVSSDVKTWTAVTNKVASETGLLNLGHTVPPGSPCTFFRISSGTSTD
ncbi:MAG TPA: right-handed parallel beta-helix repeat-containing protein [Verrucomicrobiae bacterium]